MASAIPARAPGVPLERMVKDIHDVVIVGAGPGGSATAHYLAARGLDVLLLDKAEFPRDKTCGDGLTPRALTVLDDMRVLDGLLPSARRVDGLEIVAPNGRLVRAAIPGALGSRGPALVVPRRVLDDAVRRRALASGATFVTPVRIDGIEASEHGVTVQGSRAKHPFSARARVAIVATGASMGLVRRLGLLPVSPRLMLAARGYFEGLPELTDALQIRFDGVPLPGYGWIFPLPGGSANIGVGFYTGGRARRRLPATAKSALQAFLDAPALRTLLAGAHAAGPIEGYPLRVDFGLAPSHSERVLLVGEAAGLVNPLSGEGVDYALESGRLAAQQLIQQFEHDKFSAADFADYDASLRRQFQGMFQFCNRVRDLCLHRPILDRLAGLAEHRDDLKSRLVGILFGTETPPTGLISARLLKTVLAGGFLRPGHR